MWKKVVYLFMLPVFRLKCSGHDVSADLAAPYIDDITKRCVHQGDAMLYSCSSSAKQTARRICPCRNFIKSVDAEVRTGGNAR